uniref:Enoyl-[acyl-carrier-protein] reductase, mitochondrial n=1 Tax=Hucho hucho TaxID=62062 RepID=A0A4W5KBW0_9TELE
MEEMALPALGQHSVRLRMLAAPVNPADINMLQGTYPILPVFPAVGGNEGVGEVVEVGRKVTSLRPGDWAIPWDSGFGTWRTEAVCEADDLLRDFVTLKPGATVIQNGSNSAVGQAVIQIAAALGVKTINIIRDRPDRQQLEEELKLMGADFVITEEELCEFIFVVQHNCKLFSNCTANCTICNLADSTSLTFLFSLSLEKKSLIFNNITLQGFWMTQWKRNNSKGKLAAQSSLTL